MQIKQPEAYFEIDLFHRHGKRIGLTEPSRILFEYAQKLFELAESAEKAVLELKDLKTGVLRIGTLKIYARFMMPLISSCQEKYPGTHVALDEGSSTEITRGLDLVSHHASEVREIPFVQPVQSTFLGLFQNSKRIPCRKPNQLVKEKQQLLPGRATQRVGDGYFTAPPL